MEKRKEEKYALVRQVGLLTTVPIILAVAPLLGYFLGRYLDRKLGTDPWFMTGLILLGFVAAARQVYRLVQLASRDEDESDENRGR